MDYHLLRKQELEQEATGVSASAGVGIGAAEVVSQLFRITLSATSEAGLVVYFVLLPSLNWVAVLHAALVLLNPSQHRNISFHLFHKFLE